MLNLLTYLRLTRGESHRYVVALAVILGLVLWGLLALAGQRATGARPAGCEDVTAIPSDRLAECADQLER